MRVKKLISALIALTMAFPITEIPIEASGIERITSFIQNSVEDFGLADGNDETNKSDRFIVKYSNISLADENEANYAAETEDITEVDGNEQFNVIQLEEPVDVDSFIEEMSGSNNGIEYIQPDYKLNICSTNTDNTDNTDEADATDESTLVVDENNVENVNTGSDEVIVAILDSGVDITHQSLSSKLWHNDGETDNDIDDDGNGYINDIIGWDFVKNSQLEFDESLSIDYTHGTHVAGIISDISNEIDNSNIKIMPLRVFENANAYTSDIIKAIQYAEKMGAQVVNCSFGCTEENTALEEAIANSNMLFVCAAGNHRVNVNDNPTYPACYDYDNIISVAATNDKNYISYFSNYGTNIDISADGCSIYSTTPNNTYGYSSGTSMAAAYVTKAIATIIAQNNGSIKDVKNVLLGTSSRISSLDGYVGDKRKVNINNIINDIYDEEVIYNNEENYHIDTALKTNENGDFELYGLESSNIQAISAGGYHSMVLIDNQLYSFGSDDYSQVSGLVYAGEGNIPAPGFCDIDSVRKISTRGDHAMALMKDGTVRAWGRNNYGQLGNGTFGGEGITDGYYFAEQVYGLTNIIDIAAGHDFSLALDSSGKVYAWGNNKSGIFGDSAYDYYPTPVEITQLKNIEQISAGNYHALALGKDGTVWGWGDNSDGALGVEGMNTKISIPKKINISSVGKVVAGLNNSFFIKYDGTVYACGDNVNGQIGDGTMEKRLLPIQIPITDVKDISSNGTTIFLKNNGEVYGCGANMYGQLGQGNTSFRYTSLTKINGKYAQISAGGCHTMLLTSDGKLYTMGRNHKLQCGFGYDKDVVVTPTLVSAFSNDALVIENVDVNYETNQVVFSGEYNMPNIQGHTTGWYAYYTDKLGKSRNAGVRFDVNNGRFTASFSPYMPVDGLNHVEISSNDFNGINQYEYEFDFYYDSSKLKCKAEIAYLPVEDTYVSQNGSDNAMNFNDSSMLSVNYTRRDGGTDLWGRHALLKFNIEDIDDIDWKHLVSAKLRLYVDKDSDKRKSTRTISLYNVTNEWNSADITWANNTIQTDSEPLGEFSVTGTGWDIEDAGWKEIDITKFIYENKESEFSLMAKMTSSAAHPVNIHSLENEDESTRPELVLEYSTSETNRTSCIQVTGQTEPNNNLIVRLFRPDNSIEAIEQIKSDIHGNYYYQHEWYYKDMVGTYQTIISAEGEKTVGYFTNDFRSASKVNKIRIDEPDRVVVPQLELRATLSSSQGLPCLVVTGNIINTSEIADQENMLFVGIYDDKEKLYDYSTISAISDDKEKLLLKNQIYLPTDLSEYTVKIFVCEGENLYSGSMSLISDIYSLSSNDLAAVAYSDEQETDLPIVIERVENQDEISLMSIPTNDDIKVDISISNNGCNTERILKKDNYLTVLYTVTNTSNEDKDITPILAFYRDGYLNNLNTGFSEMTLRPGATTHYTCGYSLATSDLSKNIAKIMLWNRLTGMRPYTNVIQLSKDNVDYYGDDFDSAGVVNIYTGFEGYIDSVDDTDMVKIVPDVSGLQSFECVCDKDLNIEIYDENHSQMYSQNISNGDCVVVNLNQNKEYYMKINSVNNEICAYKFLNESTRLPDYKSFDISEWGIYNIEVPAGSISIYDEKYHLLLETTSQNGKLRMDLEEGKYYAYVNNAKDYNVVTNKEEIRQLTLGKGLDGKLTSEITSAYYCFTPKEDGTYIFSAMGNCSMKGILYSETHKKLSQADNNNYNNNFNLQYDLKAGEKYYIKVQSKNSRKGDYSVYVEEPLEIISIE